MLNKLLIIAATCLTLNACSSSQKNTYQGYIEGQLTYIAAPQTGRLTTRYVQRGDRVKKGQLLFSLDRYQQIQNIETDKATFNNARAQLNNLRSGKRAPAINAIKAQIRKASANITYARQQMLRNKKLVKTDAISKQAYDQAKQNLRVNEAQRAQYKANLKNAQQAARPNQIKAFNASLQKAESALKLAEWQLKRRTIIAHVSGFIFDTYHNVGERVNANEAVLSELTPAATRALFFVPEKNLAQLHLGETIHVHCKNCTKNMTGTINYISPQAEYTPPVIYSRDTESKLVYRIEAGFSTAQARRMHPGQPITVSLKAS
jgi:HlyD family secretion protein